MNMKAEILVTADKLVSSLMKEFNEVFSYLRLRLYTSEARLYIGVDTLTPYRVDIDKPICQARVKSGCDGVVSIDGSNTYTYKKEQDMMTLEQFNAQCEADGCIKGEWR